MLLPKPQQRADQNNAQDDERIGAIREEQRHGCCKQQDQDNRTAKLREQGERQMMATVKLDHRGNEWGLKREAGVAPYQSTDPDTLRIWWSDVGVHQNLTFPVHPDPISGMHCWHQVVRVKKAQLDDHYGDISVDTQKARGVYKEWLEMTRPADQYSPDRTRRPYWMLRPLKPAPEFYKLPEDKGDLVSTD